MRDLTPEELALAPDCCDMYFINSQSLVVYVNSRTNECHASLLDEPIILGDCYYGYQIMRQIKPFDITQHEWSDEVGDCHILFNNPSWAGNDLQIEIADPNGNCADALLVKEHAIAIAKHFKLTVEDLK